MKKYFNLFFVLLFVFAGCTKNVSVDFEIISPVQDWNYSLDEKILLESNLNSSDLQWYSSIDGYLGSGRELYCFLTSGVHEITLLHPQTSECRYVTIYVKEKQTNATAGTTLVQSFPCSVESNGKEIGLVTTTGQVQNVNISSSVQTESCLMSRDFHLNGQSELSLLNMVQPKFSSVRNVNSDKKYFYVADTQNQYSTHSFECQLIYNSTNVNAYLYNDSDSETANENINACIEKFETLILPRLQTLWGSYEDIDGNGKINLVFSSSINSEGVAVGFFNQNDFFANQSDENKDGYNPYSNEMDVIYLAIPDDSNSNYTVSSVCATLAHEMTHLINFSNKTYCKIKNGQEYSTLELFLDEGLSHLTESLMGFGQSGGNQQFINYYLNDSLSYSFCSEDIYGNSDTAGRRGAICLFLQYLFVKAGGLSWNENGEFVDQGGISFLKKIISCGEYGWSAIGVYFNKATDSLFIDFCKKCYVNELKTLFDMTIKDPVTGETIYACNEFSHSKSAVFVRIMPYSFGIVDFDEDSNLFEINATDVTGNFYVLN